METGSCWFIMRILLEYFSFDEYLSFWQVFLSWREGVGAPGGGSWLTSVLATIKIYKAISEQKIFRGDNYWTWTFLQRQFTNRKYSRETITGHGPFYRNNFRTENIPGRQYLDIDLFTETISEHGPFYRDNFWTWTFLQGQL